MGDISADAHPLVVFELFWHKSEILWHFLTKPDILALLRNRLCLNDVTLSESPFLVVLGDLSA